MKKTANTAGESGAYAHGWNRTEVSRPVAVWLSVLFCVGLLAVPITDGLLGSWRAPAHKAKSGLARIAHCLSANALRWPAIVDANNAALETIKNFESSLEDSSAIGSAVRPAALDGLLSIGAAGSEEAYVGNDGWLFYRPDVDALLATSSHDSGAARGIAEFASSLSDRGIRLIVVPVPGKASIHPEKLAADGVVCAAPPVPQALRGLPDRVLSAWREKNGADFSFAPRVIDPTERLWQRKSESGEDQFLRTDSHWTPAAMQAAVRMVADVLTSKEVDVRPEKLTAQKREVSAVGDTALMHALPDTSPWLRPQSVEIEMIHGADGAAWHPDRTSPLLVLGDSYTNIYSAEDLGWGTGAGFAEHLSLALGGRVDKLAQNNAGAKSAREMLATEAARRPGWLDGKKVVVWVMAAREFVRGDWSQVDLPGGATSAVGAFFTVAPGETMDVTADVVSCGQIPAPGASPYADYLTALHLTGIEDAASGRHIANQALAYIFSMRDRKPVPLPELAEGRRVKLRLSNYAEKADKLDSLNRGDLENLEVMMEEPNFAEWIAP